MNLLNSLQEDPKKLQDMIYTLLYQDLFSSTRMKQKKWELDLPLNYQDAHSEQSSHEADLRLNKVCGLPIASGCATAIIVESI
jgi:hypothetical protein